MMNRIRTRYYTNVRGFADSTLLVAVMYDDTYQQAVLLLQGGRSRFARGYTLLDAERFVNEGTWRRVNKAEAVRMWEAGK
jgi:hypothetical protein